MLYVMKNFYANITGQNWNKYGCSIANSRYICKKKDFTKMILLVFGKIRSGVDFEEIPEHILESFSTCLWMEIEEKMMKTTQNQKIIDRYRKYENGIIISFKIYDLDHFVAQLDRAIIKLSKQCCAEQ